MSAIMLDTSSCIDAGILNMNAVSLELMALQKEFDDVLDYDRWVINLDEEEEEVLILAFLALNWRLSE